eukprot:CAMPEP_0178799794 /NCGR_PEP_ID=MMETSP0745-20121128/12486_1 /TAXON_ID=913974 /ORGANISM="Nitzschia punctata, Strain CCMP561" /LENGTH=572 /DNA_ID=CAMNT_0020458551 /DNA_START=23 /DNA_END=1741 /DNA_ORIENTATION=-
MPQSEELIQVSVWEIVISMLPLLAVALLSHEMQLNIESPILVGTIRTFVQLSLLGFVLDPIFHYGVDWWWLVMAYCLLMILLASFEASMRSKYYLKHQFWMVLGPMTVAVGFMFVFAFYVVLRPEPLWDPQYVIPIVGMLLGNCINGVSLALNSMLTLLVESSREIELLLSFGATSYEATARLLREAVRTGAMPQLNGMAIIGIISIPGMMTGQILGGTTVMQAARYQILISYFIAVSSFATILMELYLALRACFNSRGVLRTDILQKRDSKPTFLDILGSICQGISGILNLRRFRESSKRGTPSSSLETTATTTDDESTSLLSGKGGLAVSTSKSQTNNGNRIPVLSVSNLAYGFDVHDEEADLKPASRRILFENVSFELFSGGVALISGRSGVGKSSLLRVLAGLEDVESDKISLCGKSREQYSSMALWRKQVRYVPQTKVDIPGSPAAFMSKIASFQSWKSPAGAKSPSYSEMTLSTRELMLEWGMNTSLLDSEWKTLSGGESQRILVAISLSSLPNGGVVLLDESTSALDEESKLKVEKSVEGYCATKKIVAIWISHDPGQQGRMKQK